MLFLDRSGYDLVAPDQKLVGKEVGEKDSVILVGIEVEQMILAVVDDRLTYVELVKWFRARLRRRQVVRK